MQEQARIGHRHTQLPCENGQQIRLVRTEDVGAKVAHPQAAHEHVLAPQGKSQQPFQRRRQTPQIEQSPRSGRILEHEPPPVATQFEDGGIQTGPTPRVPTRGENGPGGPGRTVGDQHQSHLVALSQLPNAFEHRRQHSLEIVAGGETLAGVEEQIHLVEARLQAEAHSLERRRQAADFILALPRNALIETAPGDRLGRNSHRPQRPSKPPAAGVHQNDDQDAHGRHDAEKPGCDLQRQAIHHAHRQTDLDPPRIARDVGHLDQPTGPVGSRLFEQAVKIGLRHHLPPAYQAAARRQQHQSRLVHDHSFPVLCLLQ